MSIQLYSYGACIRMVTDSSVLMLAKSQVKRIEVVRQDTVKISLGDGTLNEILIKISDVTVPSGLVDVADLRDAITHLLDRSNQYEEEALVNQQALLGQLSEIKQLFNLWYGAQQLDLNFQQLQVNALVSIGNRLQESKESDERLIQSSADQTAELKSQSIQWQGIDMTLSAVRSAVDNLVSKEDIQVGTFGDIKVNTASIQNGISSGLIEQKSQTTLLAACNTQIGDIKSLLGDVTVKQDGQASILTDLKNTLVSIQGILTDAVKELKNQTEKQTSSDQTLANIKAQNAVIDIKFDTIIQMTTDIKGLIKK